MQAPDIVIDDFDGNPLDFLYFMTSFKQMVEVKVKNDRGRLTKLLMYLKGEPRELVKSCVYLRKRDCYTVVSSLW